VSIRLRALFVTTAMLTLAVVLPATASAAAALDAIAPPNAVGTSEDALLMLFQVDNRNGTDPLSSVTATITYSTLAGVSATLDVASGSGSCAAPAPGPDPDEETIACTLDDVAPGDGGYVQIAVHAPDIDYAGTTTFEFSVAALDGATPVSDTDSADATFTRAIAQTNLFKDYYAGDADGEAISPFAGTPGRDYHPGDSIAYRVRVANAPSAGRAAEDVVVHATLANTSVAAIAPSDVQVRSGSATGVACTVDNVGTRAYECSLDDTLAVGETTYLQFNVPTVVDDEDYSVTAAFDVEDQEGAGTSTSFSETTTLDVAQDPTCPEASYENVVTRSGLNGGGLDVALGCSDPDGGIVTIGSQVGSHGSIAAAPSPFGPGPLHFTPDGPTLASPAGFRETFQVVVTDNEGDTVTVPVTFGADTQSDLSIAASAPAGLELGGAGGTVTYTATIANAGPDAVGGVVGSFKVPNEALVVSGAWKGVSISCAPSTNVGGPDAQYIECPGASAIAPGASATMTLAVKYVPGARGLAAFPFIASVPISVAVANDEIEDETDPANNAATVATRLTRAAEQQGEEETTEQQATPGDDVYRGGAGAQVFRGLQGADRFYGFNGPDRFFGGSGNDAGFGGNGADYLNGGTGDDRLVGGAGNDRIFGSDGNDVVLGNGGNDLVSGGRGNDEVRGGAGNDSVLCGGDDEDVAYGESGNDFVSCRDGRGGDTIQGGSGRDTCVGDRGDVFLGCERRIVRRR